MAVTGWWPPVIFSGESGQMSATLIPEKEALYVNTNSQC
jgi:hypothetical protein